MTQTPLYDSLMKLKKKGQASFSMPGHHNKLPSVKELEGSLSLDVTEWSSTGNLFEGGDAIEQSELIWAKAFGMESCLYLTGGSTEGNLTSLALCCKPGDRILVDRGSHRSVYNGMALLDLNPVYIKRPWLEEEGISGAIDPKAVEKLLKSNPDIKTVCITSPTYYGLISDLESIAKVVHKYGAKLIVDAAHGVHLTFFGYEGYHHADVVVTSAHKTLPVMGQAALLFANGFSMDELRRAGSMFGSSSPSYPMMVSLERALADLGTMGPTGDFKPGANWYGYQRAALQVAQLRQTYPSLQEELHLDPTRFTLKCANGKQLARQLEKRGICPEMSDNGHIVFICTCADSDEDFERLCEELDKLTINTPKAFPQPPELPEVVMSLQRARFSDMEEIPLKDAENRIAACQIAPYPPGVPVVGYGERITKKHMAYLSKIGYNTKEYVQIVRE